MRITLQTLTNTHAQRGVISRRVIRGGQAGEALASSPSATQGEQLSTTQGGTVYPVFILGVHDIDDSTVRWVL